MGIQDNSPTVLIIEDDEPLLFAMTRLFADAGYLVLSADTGHDALETLRTPLAPIDVVVMDVHLPDVDGVSLCGRLRELYPRVPVIVCSGEAEPAEVGKLVELGAFRYFRKPISTKELLASVEAALNLQS